MCASTVRPVWLGVVLLFVLPLSPAPAAAQGRNLDIYWVDTEGGAATLVVSPSGESLLVDAGWEVGDRDATRIASAAADRTRCAPTPSASRRILRRISGASARCSRWGASDSWTLAI